MGAGIVNVDVGTVLSGAGQLVKDIRTAWTGKDVTLDAQLSQLETQINGARDAAQAAIDEQEAQSKSLFNSAWRPCVAWICVVSFALIYIIFPLTNFTLGFFGKQLATPALDSSTLMTLLFGMLGLGAMRSYDKMQGTTK